MNILHLTDLHFNHEVPREESDRKWDKIVCKIVNGCQDEKINMVAVTGDFSYHGSCEEFDRVENFLQKLLDKLELTRAQVVMCAGNHDADTDEECSSFKHYEEFEERFCDGRKDIIRVREDDVNYVFASMNTCRETSLLLYEHATLQTEECKKLDEIQNGETGVLLLHHPPETIMNQELFEKIMTSGKISLILSGHQHMSLPRLYKAGNIVVVGGMAISPHRKWMASGCQIVKIYENGKVEAKQIDV